MPAGKRILFVSGWYPFPANNGSKLRIYNLLRGLAAQHEVTLIAFADQPVPNDSPELSALCRKVHVVPSRPFKSMSLRSMVNLLRPVPRVVVETYVPLMAERIHQEIASSTYDVMIASEWSTAAYWSSSGGLPVIVDDIELGVFEAMMRAGPTPLHRLRQGLPWLKLHHYLQRRMPHLEACTVVSEGERVIVRRLAAGHTAVEVIPNCVSLLDYQDVRVPAQPGTLIFAGSFRYFANHDAMVWFQRDVYPHIRARTPNVHLTITGDHANLPLPAADNRTLTGYVDNVASLIAGSWLSLAPIRLGGGTRLKVLESMALRSPVVATSKGAEGLDVQDNVHLLIADTPETYAAAVVRLLTEPGLRERLADRAYELVRAKYDWAAVMPRFLHLVDRVATAPRPSNTSILSETAGHPA